MKRYESEHYIFYYSEGTKAEQDILEIAAYQEACFKYICMVLNVKSSFKIEYFLCETPEDVGRLSEDEPCNGFAHYPNTIYAVYNEIIRCIGFHEDAHIISYTIGKPESTAIREGLAMYFDRKWWSINNLDWCGFFIETNRYISAAELLDNEKFYSTNCAISYPIMGAFTDYLISSYGSAKYYEFYSYEDCTQAINKVYNKSPEELNSEFMTYVKLFFVDNELKNRMSELFEM